MFVNSSSCPRWPAALGPGAMETVSCADTHRVPAGCALVFGDGGGGAPVELGGSLADDCGDGVGLGPLPVQAASTASVHTNTNGGANLRLAVITVP